MNIKQLNELLENTTKYKSWNGKTIYRTFANLEYYFLKCEELGITPKIIKSGLSYEASNQYIDFDWCEHDLLIHPKKVISGTGENGENGEQLEYKIIDTIKKGMTIWNIGEHAPKNIIPLTVLIKGTYTINSKEMYAIITDKAQQVLQGVGFAGDRLSKMKKYIKKYTEQQPNICQKIKKAVEVLELIDEREKRQGDKMTNTNIYIFDTAHYLEWCKIWNLNKNNQRVLQLFKSRCDFERVFKEIKKC